MDMVHHVNLGAKIGSDIYLFMSFLERREVMKKQPKMMNLN